MEIPDDERSKTPMSHDGQVGVRHSPGPGQVPYEHLPTEFSWQVHTALEAWTTRADLKASILLAFQGSALVVVLPWPLPVFIPLLLLGAIVLGILAVLPALGSRRRLRRQHGSNLVYFGHLRWWSPDDLAGKLEAVSRQDATRMLAEQLVRLSRLSWRKHRLLQWSVLLSGAAFVAAGAWTAWGMR
jgi:hypothetical protein